MGTETRSGGGAMLMVGGGGGRGGEGEHYIVKVPAPD